MRGLQSYSQILEEDCVKEQVVIVERVGRVGVITLNRPKVLNALNDELMNELGAALLAFDADDEIGTIVIAGSPRAFWDGPRRCGILANSCASTLATTPTSTTLTPTSRGFPVTSHFHPAFWR
jgi:hypothetical protein